MAYRSDLGLLLLHALPLNNKMWSKQMSLLPNQTCAPNLYEFGKSIQVWAEKSLAMAQARKLIVVGCSVGGSCALEVAHLAPDRIAALVLIGTKARHDPNPSQYMEALDVVKNQGIEAAWENYWEPLFQKPYEGRVADIAKEIAMHQSPHYLMNGLSAFHTRPSREGFVSKCEFPIHVIAGEHDRFPGVDYCRQLASSSKYGTLNLISSCGHYVPMVKPKELNVLLSDIIKIHAA